MAVLKREGADKVYAAAQIFQRQALERADSMLTPGRAVWTSEALEEFHRRFVTNFDDSDAGFSAKLERQLEGAEDSVIQLAAETLLMHFLINSDMTGATKRNQIGQVLGWMKEPAAIPAEIDDALNYGIAWPGTIFNTKRYRQVNFIIDWMLAWRELGDAKRDEILSDPWSFKEFMEQTQVEASGPQRNVLRHLLFPEYFERIMSQTDRNAVISTFGERIGGVDRARSLDVDKALLEIRQALEPEYGDYDYYDTPAIKSQWKPGESGEFPLLDHVLRSYPGWSGFSDPRFVHDETNYKRVASEKAQALLDAGELRELIEGGRSEEVIAKIERVAQLTNLLWLQVPAEGDLSILYRQTLDKREFVLAVFDLLHGEGSSPELLGRFAEYTSSKGLPTKWALPTYLLMLMNPDDDFFVKPQATKWLLQKLSAGFDSGSKASGELYGRILDAVQDLRAKLEPFGPSGVLDIQSYVWVAYRARTQEPVSVPGQPEEETNVGESGSVYDFMASRGFAFPDWLVTDYVLSLATKPLVILSGISGTGKTKMAQLVSEYCAPKETVRVPTSRPEPDGASVLHEAKSVLLEHFYIAIPNRHAHLFVQPERGGGLDVELRVPGRSSMPGRLQNVGLVNNPNLMLRLYMKGEARDWIRDNFSRGDYIRITPDSPESLVIQVERIPVESVEEPVLSQRIAFLSVRPDWTDNRALLGYYNPLMQQYQGTELLRLLLRATTDTTAPHFVVLDEMNLAKVEYYFSDFLSAMESETEMVLHDVDDEGDGTGGLPPSRLSIPRNVFFTGTVNVDETTYMFSPKVLDRANTIEFNDVDLALYGLGKPATGTFRFGPDVSIEAVLKQARKPEPSDWLTLDAVYKDRLRAIHQIMYDHGLHFGYRVANEIARYLNLANEFVGQDQLDFALDLQVLQKVLPKLSGSGAKLEKPLKALLEHLQQEELHHSAAKVERMLDTVRKVGFVSFVE